MTSGKKFNETAAQRCASQAQQHYAAGRFSDSGRAYRQALTVDPRNVDSLYGLGLVSYSLGDHVDSVQWFERCLAVDSRHQNSRFYLGLAAESQNQRDVAISQYSAVLAINPAHKGAIKQLASLLAAGRVATGPTSSSTPVHRRPKFVRSWPNSVVGVVLRIRARQEVYGTSPGGLTVIDMRVQTYNSAEEPDRQVMATVRGRKIRGPIPEVGDWVELKPDRDRHGSLQPNTVNNLTADATLRVPVGWRG